MILCKEYEFEIQENKGSKVLKGTFRDLNSEEQKELKKQNKTFDEAIKKGSELGRKLERVNKLLLVAEKKDDFEEVEKLLKQKYQLEDDLISLEEKTKPEVKEAELLKWKFEKCVSGENKGEIIELAETYGYKKMQLCIFEDINEKKQKESN